MAAPAYSCPNCGHYDWALVGDEDWKCEACGAEAGDKTLGPSPSREPDGTPLSEGSHGVVMAQLQALQTDEQRRRVAVVKKATKGLPMQRRVAVAKIFLLDEARQPARQWNALVRAFIVERKRNPQWGMEEVAS